jgi:hypothetical protein
MARVHGSIVLTFSSANILRLSGTPSSAMAVPTRMSVRDDSHLGVPHLVNLSTRHHQPERLKRTLRQQLAQRLDGHDSIRVGGTRRVALQRVA